MPAWVAPAVSGGISGLGALISLLTRPKGAEYEYETSPWMQEIWDLLQNLPRPDVGRRTMAMATPAIGRERGRTAGEIGTLATRGGYSGSPAHGALLARLGERTSGRLGEVSTRAGLAQEEAETGQRRFRLGALSNLAGIQQRGMGEAQRWNLEDRIGRQQWWPQLGAGMMGMGGNILAGVLGRPDMEWLEELMRRYQTQGGQGQVMPQWLNQPRWELNQSRWPR